MPAQGSSARLAIKQQAAVGTAATGNYQLVPVVSYSLPQIEPFLDNDLAGTGRDSPALARGATTVEGSASVPVDDAAFGHWLSMLLGPPVTTGAGPYVHTFTSGKDVVSYYTIEHQQPDVTPPIYLQAVDVVVNTLTLSITPAGFANCELGLLARSNAASGVSGAGTPVAYDGLRFLQQQNALERNGTDIAKAVEGSIRFTNNITVDRYIGEGGLPGDFALGLTDVNGDIAVRLNDLVLYGDATSKTAVELGLNYTRDANRSILFLMENVELSEQGTSLEGPAGVRARFNFKGFKTAAEPQSMTVVLTNNIASYAA
jgi:hypothetical protein